MQRRGKKKKKHGIQLKKTQPCETSETNTSHANHGTRAKGVPLWARKFKERFYINMKTNGSLYFRPCTGITLRYKKYWYQSIGLFRSVRVIFASRKIFQQRQKWTTPSSMRSCERLYMFSTDRSTSDRSTNRPGLAARSRSHNEPGRHAPVCLVLFFSFRSTNRQILVHTRQTQTDQPIYQHRQTGRPTRGQTDGSTVPTGEQTYLHADKHTYTHTTQTGRPTNRQTDRPTSTQTGLPIDTYTYTQTGRPSDTPTDR